jgi:hypothetical protein
VGKPKKFIAVVVLEIVYWESLVLAIEPGQDGEY